MATDVEDDLGDLSVPEAARPPRTGRGLKLLAVLLAGVLAVLVAFLAGRLTAAASYPSDLGADAGFARDMQVHHAQAVQMSLIVRDGSTDPAVRTLAYDITRTQQQQAGQMYGWLEIWGLPQTSGREPMAWAGDGMQHGADGTGMPGMATDQQLDQLQAARGRAADVLFLRLMIAHHRGGVEMAQAGLDRAKRPEVLHLARTIVAAQTSEIALMEQMLAERS